MHFSIIESLIYTEFFYINRFLTRQRLIVDIITNKTLIYSITARTH